MIEKTFYCPNCNAPWNEEKEVFLCPCLDDTEFDTDETTQRLMQENEALQARVDELKKEIEILRQYGNKTCTAMADEVLEEMKNPI